MDLIGKFDHTIDNLTKSFLGKVKFFKGIPKSQPSVLEQQFKKAQISKICGFNF